MDPTAMQHIKMYDGVSLEFGLPFLSTCIALQELHVDLTDDDGDALEVEAGLNFPVLRKLIVHGRTDVFSR